MRRLLILVLALTAVAASAAQAPRSAVAPCAAAVRHDVLPVWMRAGFSSPKPRVPYVLGEHGRIGAILFGSPLNAPPAKTKNNKVLWVSRRPWKDRAALWIRMQRMDGTKPVGAPVTHVVPGGPGPSYVDAPSPGCWRLTLSWAGRQDTLDLAYVRPTD